MVGMTSPPLLGSSGVMPLTIVSPLPDICRHMSNCIARAEKEVFLATNYWQSSDASTIITNSLKELSRRAGARGEKAIVKIMYDRGNAKQVAQPRYSSCSSLYNYLTWTGFRQPPARVDGGVHREECSASKP